MTPDYDLVVLGAGPGGYVAAIRASQLGLRTTIVEQRYWGGVCLHVGCIPSKALLRNAELVHLLTRQAPAFGIHVQGALTVDYASAVRRSRQVAEGRVKGVGTLMRQNKIAQVEGRATFAHPHTLTVDLSAGGTTSLRFRHAIIATGATTRLLPRSPRSERVMTYEAQILAEHLAASMIIMGSGAIGVEFAYILSAYGVAVTIVESLDQLVSTEDAEISAELQRRFTHDLGITVLTGTRVEAITDTGVSYQVLATLPDGSQRTLEAERVLQAIGFAPTVAGYGFERAGVQLTERGAIAIDRHMQTSVPHRYAIGDVTGKLLLAHVAQAMGIIAAERIAGYPSAALEIAMLPRAIYCQPQIASFGYTEAQARAEGYEVQVAPSRFRRMARPRGWATIVVSSS